MRKLEEILKKLTTGWIIILLILATILMPFIVLIILKNPSSIGMGQSESWISFYGSYFGAIISGIITLLLIRIHLNIKDEERVKANSEFINTLINNYFRTVEEILKKTISQIKKKKKTEDTFYIPHNSLFFDDSYFMRLLETDLKYEEKFEFISLFHSLEGLIHMSERNMRMHEKQNILMIENNVSTINSRIIAKALGEDFTESTEEDRNLNGLYENIIYPRINEDTENYVKTAKDVLQKIEIIKSKQNSY